MDLSLYLESMTIDALVALAACLVLALVSRRIQSQPEAPPHGFEEGDRVYVEEDDLEGLVSDVERSGRIWVKLPEPHDFQWYTADSLKKLPSLPPVVSVE